MRTRSLLLIFVAAFVVEQAAMLVPAAKNAAFPRREDRAVRGRRVAERMGCFGCHGSDGAHGIANPGGKDGVVPALAGGEMMMWAHDETELRTWILDGRLPDAAADETAATPARALAMPAYRAMLSGEELDDLVAYLKSICGLQFPDDARAEKGLEKMHDLGCFGCHGPMGTGGRSNPRSLKGYVPGFGGEDYRELVRDGDELREWIRNGTTDRFARNPVARAILGRQALKMPAYGEHLDEPGLENVASAVEWLATGNWHDQPVP